MSKRDKFIETAMSQVNRGIYVWGGNGENLLVMDDPDAWIRKKETSTANAKRAITLFNARKLKGVDPIRAFDCSGLVYWCQKQAGIGYGDKTANWYWKECEPVDILEAGDLVFHHNGLKCTHVGIYVGDGWVVESFGRDEGVVKTQRKKGYWNRQGRLKKIAADYGMLGDANCDGSVTPADAALVLRYIKDLDDLTEQGKKNADVNLDGKITEEDAKLIMKYIVGDATLPPKTKVRMTGTLCLREDGCKTSKCIGYARKGHTYSLLGVDKDTGWYYIDANGKKGYISCNTKYTILE